MFITPDDPRKGMQRQAATRALLQQLVAAERQRKLRARSATLQSGGMRRIARPMGRKMGMGIRNMAAGRLGGGIPDLLENRGLGMQPGSKYEPLPYVPPVMPSPMPSSPLPGPGMEPPPDQSFLPDLTPPPPTSYANQFPSLTPEIPHNAIAGLIPLGNGAWYDMSQGRIYGPTGLSER